MATKQLYLSVIIWISFSDGIFGAQIGLKQCNDKVEITDLSDNKWIVEMDENNHSNQNETVLFQITGIESSKCSNVEVLFQDDNQFRSTIDNNCIFTAQKTFDYEKNEFNYLFKLRETLENEATVRFRVNNIDDEPPVLGTFNCKLDEYTDYTVDNSNCSTTLTDPDGWLAYTTFIINPESDGNIFAVGLRHPLPNNDTKEATAYMYLLQQLQYNVTNFYQMTVIAKDSGSNTSPEESAVVNVKNIRSRPPVWSMIKLFDQFNEKQEQNYDIQALDGDTGINAQICYKKISEDIEDAKYIEITKNETTNLGHVHVNPIDRDKYDLTVYRFTVSAFVCDNEDYFTNMEVQYYILDIDDNPPNMIHNDMDNGTDLPFIEDGGIKTVNLSYLENYSTSYNFSTNITDRDTGENAQFIVSLEQVDDSPVDYTQAYLIVPEAAYKTGLFKISVKNKTYLDYENEIWKQHSYYVVSNGYINGTKTDKTDRMLILVNLIDYNDEIPIFDDPPYTVSINETAKKGDFVITAHATDRDAEDAVLKMDIVGSYAEKRLNINSNGDLTVAIDNAFDYDVLNSIDVQVTATDNAKHVERAPVTITILDVNNKAPIIDQTDQVQVEENQRNGIVLATITASDVDTTADLTSRIIWDSSYVTKVNSRVTKTETIETAMKFLDVENTQTNNGRGLQIKLKVVNNNDDNPDKPDFETFDTLYLNISVEDRNTDPEFEHNRFTYSLVVIAILDVNDNPPYFPSSNNEKRQVQERALLGVSVGSIKAIDPDTNSNITYHCIPEYEKFDWVDVNSITGAITVKEGGIIDADTDKTYYFNYTCWAHDGVFFSQPLNVSIYVIDTNDKKPVIDFPDEVHVKEKSPPGTPIAQINTSDMDRDEPYHTVNCRLYPNSDPDCTDEFQVDNQKVLTVLARTVLDRDTGRKSYTCMIECYDNPLGVNNQVSNTVNKTVLIVLDDINDHAPVLDTPEIKCLENIKKDESLQEILGTDIDAGDNALIEFSLISVIDVITKKDIKNMLNIFKGDDYVVNDTQKRVHLVAVEDLKDNYGTYTVTLDMRDKGDPVQTTTPNPTLTLTIDKWNFDTPTITFPKGKDQYIVVTEQQPGKPLVLFNSTDTLSDFKATDGATEDCSKWDVKFSFKSETYADDDIFYIEYKKPCDSQLQINKNFNAELVYEKEYKLTITASVATGTEKQDEAPYSTSTEMNIVFFNNSYPPIFKNKNTWEVKFVEVNTTQSAIPLEEQAEYEVIKGFPVFYHFLSDNKTLYNFFEVDKSTGSLSIIGNLTYDYDREVHFQIVAANTSIASDVKILDQRSCLNVTVDLIPRNRRPPHWKNSKVFGAIMPTFYSGNLVITAQAYDEDVIDQGNLICSIDGPITPIGQGLDKVKKDSFYLTTEDDTAKIYLDFTVESTMTGRFEFKLKVEDHPDGYGNGPFEDIADTTVFIITNDNTVDFHFYNDIVDVQDKEQDMLNIISDIVGYKGYRQNIDSITTDGVMLTRARLYFINSQSGVFELISRDTILNIVTNVNTYSKLGSELRSKDKLILASFQTDNAKSGNSEAALKAWLTGVSVVLGLLVLILLITLFLKTRQLNNRIKKLTTPKFGSQDSGLNRIGITAPTTNKHAIEGSNPVYKNDELKKPKNMNDFDTQSIRSGDSDLVGVENNPEFDYNFNDDKTTYL